MAPGNLSEREDGPSRELPEACTYRNLLYFIVI
jgi:hypothetical protein